MYNEDAMEQQEEIEFPWLVFKIKDNLYTVNSKRITSIVMLSENVTKIPNVPDYMMGLIHLRGNVIPLVDLRLLFNIKSVQEEYDEFTKMIDDRKQDHIHWVDEFEHSIDNEEEFKLTTDPHKCALGKWYDNYTTDVETIKFQLKKLDEPHKKIHQAALDVQNCPKDCENCNREKCLKTILKETKEKNMPYLLGLLDQVKELFKLHFKEMVIVFEDDNSFMGILVDEVLSVENITPFEETEEIKKMCKDGYVKGVAKGHKNNDVLLILDKEKIMNMA
ncbi:MAG: chemotaxis protein CheW [Sedimentibacter sp.]